LAFDGRKYDGSLFVIPAEAGIQWLLTVAKWIPAFAGMTLLGNPQYDGSLFVIPAPDSNIRGQASAGIHWLLTVAKWIPVFAGMTLLGNPQYDSPYSSFPRKRESIGF
jgi:hypothetical protein